MKFNLSEITELIKSRRSIRPESFSSRKVQLDQIELVLNNAQWAPNHGNTEPWRFTVFHSEDSRKVLSQKLGELYLQKTSLNDHQISKAHPETFNLICCNCRLYGATKRRTNS